MYVVSKTACIDPNSLCIVHFARPRSRLFCCQTMLHSAIGQTKTSMSAFDRLSHEKVVSSILLIKHRDLDARQARCQCFIKHTSLEIGASLLANLFLAPNDVHIWICPYPCLIRNSTLIVQMSRHLQAPMSLISQNIQIAMNEMNRDMQSPLHWSAAACWRHQSARLRQSAMSDTRTAGMLADLETPAIYSYFITPVQSINACSSSRHFDLDCGGSFQWPSKAAMTSTASSSCS